MNKVNPNKKKGGMRKHALSFKNAISQTKQSFKDGCKIDNILRKYGTVGLDPNDVGIHSARVAQMPFGKSDTQLDYQAALNAVVETQAYFARLPSTIREKFNHEPANLVAFMSNPKNMDECVKMGIFRKEEKEGSARKDAPKAPEAPNEAPNKTETPTPKA